MQLLQVKNLHWRRIGGFTIDVKDFTAKRGQLISIIGRNGSGKTTFIEILAGLHPKVRDKIMLLDKKLDDNLLPMRKHIGYIPDDSDWFIYELTGKEYIDVLAETFSKAKTSSPELKQNAKNLCQELGFEMLDTPIVQLSHGNKRKLQIVAGLMHKPDVVLLDELHNGLDAITMPKVDAILRRYIKEGTCVIASTHNFSWAKKMSTSVAFMKAGRLSQAMQLRARNV